MRYLRLAAVLMAVAISVGLANAQQHPADQHANTQLNEHWIATWAAPLSFVQPGSPTLPFGPARGRGTGPSPQSQAPAPQNTNAGNSTATPTSAPPPPTRPLANAAARPAPPTSLANQTVRMIAHISLGGSRFRLRLTNAFGSKPVTIDAVHVAIQSSGASIAPNSDRTVLFNGKPSVTLIPGAELTSDPFALEAPNLAHLAVSLFLSQESGAPTVHASSLYPVAYVAPGNVASAPELPDATASAAFYWLSGLDVIAPRNASTIVAMGDSITDASGAQAADQDWPSLLAARLLSNKPTHDLAVVDVGISGNRLLNDGIDISGLARFDRHVLAQPGVRWLVLLEGINDIGFSAMARTNLSADDVIEAYRQIIAGAHAHGIKVVGCTLLPDKGAFYYREDRATVRQQVNNWIRTSGAFDSVVDLDAAMRDPAAPEQLRPDLQRGDHLHPNAAGYAVMARAFNLATFTN